MVKHKPTGLSAADFFARALPGFSKTDASKATPLAYSTIHEATRPDASTSAGTARALQAWSEAAIGAHGVYISAAKTMGLSEPVAAEA